MLLVVVHTRIQCLGGGVDYGPLWMVMMSSSDTLATQQMTDDYIRSRAHTYVYVCV